MRFGGEGVVLKHWENYFGVGWHETKRIELLDSVCPSRWDNILVTVSTLKPSQHPRLTLFYYGFRTVCHLVCYAEITDPMGCKKSFLATDGNRLELQKLRASVVSSFIRVAEIK
jgi:hypothetical protein